MTLSHVLTLTQKSLEMVRSGQFHIHTYGPNHCGTSSEFDIRYHLKCVCSPRLDQRGFLFDQLNIQSFFDSIKRTQLSCERLTVVCLEQLLDHILTENSVCEIHRIELTLSPEPYLASMLHAIDGNGKPLTKSKVKAAKKTKGHRSVEVMAAGSQAHDPGHQHQPSHTHYLFQEKV